MIADFYHDTLWSQQTRISSGDFAQGWVIEVTLNWRGREVVHTPNHILGVPVWNASLRIAFVLGLSIYQRHPNNSSESTKSFLGSWLGFDRDSSTLTWTLPAVASQRRHKTRTATDGVAVSA